MLTGGWLRRFGAHDISHGTGGLRFVDLLALIARTPTGERLEDSGAGLLLDPVTSTDRCVAIGLLLTMRPGVVPEKMMRRAHKLLGEYKLWDTLKKELNAEGGEEDSGPG